MLVIRTYADEGKSGLKIDGRDSLKKLINDIKSGPVDFRVVLVYDISRWGRFQNIDESAYYEYLCTSFGIRVVYCAEQFVNDGTPMSAVIKSIKRAMAGEYSRDLSKKVYAGHCRLGAKGFRQGAQPGYGLRRQIIDERGNPKGFLGFKEKKGMLTDRVRLAPGSDIEIQTISLVYKLFIKEGMHRTAIANHLNSHGIRTDLGRLWTRHAVHQLLTNEKYIGNNVYNRVCAKLKGPRIPNPPDNWIRCTGAWEGIVSPDLFFRARDILAARSNNIGDKKMLGLLSGLLQRSGRLTSRLIDEQVDMPSPHIYTKHFGSLLQAYKRIGYRPEHSYQHLEENKVLRGSWRSSVVSSLVEKLRSFGALVEHSAKTDLLKINNEWTLSVVPFRCHTTREGRCRWWVNFDTLLQPDLTVAIRLNRDNKSALDYYLIPRIDIEYWPRHITENNDSVTGTYRFHSLDFLIELAGRSPLTENM